MDACKALPILLPPGPRPPRLFRHVDDSRRPPRHGSAVAHDEGDAVRSLGTAPSACGRTGLGRSGVQSGMRFVLSLARGLSWVQPGPPNPSESQLLRVITRLIPPLRPNNQFFYGTEIPCTKTIPKIRKGRKQRIRQRAPWFPRHRLWRRSTRWCPTLKSRLGRSRVSHAFLFLRVHACTPKGTTKMRYVLHNDFCWSSKPPSSYPKHRFYKILKLQYFTIPVEMPLMSLCFKIFEFVIQQSQGG